MQKSALNFQKKKAENPNHSIKSIKILQKNCKCMKENYFPL